MLTESKISVVIATLNRPDSLANCLMSLEEQTVTPYEVIIVVDGELTEPVQKTIDTFKDNGNLNIVQINNGRRRGLQHSRNKGVDTATGDVVAFIDDDETLASDWTFQIRRGYEVCSDAVGVGGMIAMQEIYFHNVFYKSFVRLRERLFRKKLGKINFIGMPYLVLTIPSDDLVLVDFLHGGNQSYRRDIIAIYKFDPSLPMREEFDLGVRLCLKKKKKLVYNSKAIAYHHHNPVGGIALWGSERLYRDFRDHVPYLMRDFNLKYLRLAAFTIAVFLYSMVTLKPKCMKAVMEGFQLYRKHKSRENS